MGIIATASDAVLALDAVMDVGYCVIFLLGAILGSLVASAFAKGWLL